MVRVRFHHATVPYPILNSDMVQFTCHAARCRADIALKLELRYSRVPIIAAPLGMRAVSKGGGVWMRRLFG